MVDKMEKKENTRIKNASSWSPMDAKFLVRGFEVAHQETRHVENSP